MTWLISRTMMERYSNSRYSPEPEGESSGESCSDGEPSAPSKSIDMPQAYFAPGRTTAAWNRSRSGVTFDVSEVETQTAEQCLKCFARSVIDSSSVAGSHARTFPWPERERALRGSDQACGSNRPESFAKYDPGLRGWRTRQRSLEGGYIEFSETWPRWGSMRNGECYPLKMPYGLRELRKSITAATESGSAVRMPTLNCEGYRSDGELRLLAKAVNSEEEFFALSRKATKTKKLKALKVPTMHGFSKDGKSNGPSGSELGRRINQLERAKALKLPTLTVQDAENNGPPSQMKRNSLPLNAVVGGSLNPTWAEWLMGWPIGWTDLRPLGTDKFQQWLNSHGKC